MNEWLLLQNDLVVCAVLFALLITGALGFPPEDFTILLAGIVLNHGKSNLQTIFVLCYLGTIIGDIFIYSVGRWFGGALFTKEWFRKRVKPARLRLVRQGLERRRLPMIFIARHLFYLRTITFLTCGAVKMRFTRFLIADCISALVSVSLMLWLGYFASEHYETVTRYIGKAKIFSAILALAIVGAVAYFIVRHYRASPPSEEA